VGSTGSKNENITLWNLDQERGRNRATALKKLAQKASEQGSEEGRRCRNCKKGFDEPKLIYVCPHCLKEIEEEVKTGCRYFFGYLNQKEKTESVPQECVECEKVMECMLSQEHSKDAVSEIRKWY
jgi:hypothetical protein